MTDSRQRRTDTLRQAARRKSEAKTKAAEAAIRTLVKRGEPVTFQSVQRSRSLPRLPLRKRRPPRADRTAPQPVPPEIAPA